MEPVRVVVSGAAGKMGREIVNSLSQEPGIQIVGATELKVSGDSFPLPNGSAVPFSADLETIITKCKPQVIVDFTTAKAVMPMVRTAAKHGVNVVIGTTGLTPDDIKEIESLANAQGVGAVVASNFALGAVMMMHLAKIAAKYFDCAEIIELHHNRKADAPSGTALSTARAMAQAKGKAFSQSAEQAKPADSRGGQVEGIAIHSVRLPGLLAHQEVLFGTSGQTLSIRHDTISRECYMPGIILAVKEVIKRKGLIYGLDKLLGL